MQLAEAWLKFSGEPPCVCHPWLGSLLISSPFTSLHENFTSTRSSDSATSQSLTRTPCVKSCVQNDSKMIQLWTENSAVRGSLGAACLDQCASRVRPLQTARAPVGLHPNRSSRCSGNRCSHRGAFSSSLLAFAAVSLRRTLRARATSSTCCWHVLSISFHCLSVETSVIGGYI